MDKVRVVVVGGGAAGTAAAVEAARLGVSVTLVDEHPVDLVTMGMDTPYFFGSRLLPTLADRGAMLERVIGASESLQQAAEIGVDIRLGTCVWGSFVPGDNNQHWRTRCLGLADGTRSWLVEYEALILAAGARDLVLAFPGWDLPGVLGAQAASALMTRYQALGARRMVILGSGPLGLLVAQQAIEHGIEAVGIVDVAEKVRGPAPMWQPWQRAACDLLGHTSSKRFR
jgi:pyridine nucleotide-disulfide oxidoreductase